MPIPNRPYIPTTNQYEDMDADEAIDLDLRRSAKPDSFTANVEAWLKTTLTVIDEPSQNRFIVKIGSLLFPVGYEQMTDETRHMLADGEDKVHSVSLKPIDKKKEAADELAKQLAKAREELKKPLVVKRSTIEKGYEPKD